ncbi:MAG: hypothetical protein IIB36_05565 [Gemmatimonadetes bacterium]|nr:hypothetical protein [Gemmatimonadota bacterium]
MSDDRQGPALTLSDSGPPDDSRTERVDWILVGGPIGSRSVETVLHCDRGRSPSDHNPVAARLEIR